MAKKGPSQTKTLKHYFSRDANPRPPAAVEELHDAIVVATPDVPFPSEQASKKRRLSPKPSAERPNDETATRISLSSRKPSSSLHNFPAPSASASRNSEASAPALASQPQSSECFVVIEVDQNTPLTTEPRNGIGPEGCEDNSGSPQNVPRPGFKNPKVQHRRTELKSETNEVEKASLETSQRAQVSGNLSFRSTSSLPTLASRTPSVPSTFGSQHTIPGSSREMPLVIPSSQSDEDLEDDTVVVSPRDEMRNGKRSGWMSLDGSNSNSSDERLDSNDQPVKTSSKDNDKSNVRTLFDDYVYTESSDESLLDDFDDFIRRARPAKPEPPETPNSATETLRRSTRSTARPSATTTTSSTIDGYVASELPKAGSRFSLTKLVKDSVRDAKIQADLASAKEALEEAQLSGQGLHDDANGLTSTDGDLLASVMKANEDQSDVQRVLQAIDRTDARQTELVWYFFNEASDESITHRASWPSDEGTSSPWIKRFRNSSEREDSFRSGLAARCFLVHVVSNEIMWWTLTAMLAEPDSHLAAAYSDALRASGQLGEFLDAKRLKKAFEQLGAKPAATDIATTAEPLSRSQKAPRRQLPIEKITRLVAFLGDISGFLITESKIYALVVLARLCLDIDCMRDSILSATLSRSIKSLTDSIPDHELRDAVTRTTNAMFRSSRHVLLQHQLLLGFPGDSSRLVQIKWPLALAFLLRDASLLEWSSTAAEQNNADERVRTFIYEELTLLEERGDYRTLTASTQLLQTAVNILFTPTPGMASDPPKDRNEAKGDQAKDDEVVFNKRVDSLRASVNSLFSRIADGGVSNMQRTEAKCVLKDLLGRLDYGVRTKPRPKKPIFGSNTRAQSDFLGDFLRQYPAELRT